MVLTMKKNIMTLNDEANHAKEEASKLRRQLADREAAFKISEKKFEDSIEAAEAVMASLKAKVSELDEELLDSSSAYLVEGRARLALEVCSGRATREDCQKIVDDYLENIGDMEDLLPKEAGAIVPVMPLTGEESKAEEAVTGETSSTK